MTAKASYEFEFPSFSPFCLTRMYICEYFLMCEQLKLLFPIIFVTCLVEIEEFTSLES